MTPLTAIAAQAASGRSLHSVFVGATRHRATIDRLASQTTPSWWERKSTFQGRAGFSPTSDHKRDSLARRIRYSPLRSRQGMPSFTLQTTHVVPPADKWGSRSLTLATCAHPCERVKGYTTPVGGCARPTRKGTLSNPLCVSVAHAVPPRKADPA